MASLSTRMQFQRGMLLSCATLFIFLLIINISKTSLIGIEDAIFLAKNSFKEFREQHIPNGFHIGDRITDNLTNSSSPRVAASILDFDLQYPFDNVVNSIFPIDTTIEYNSSDKNHNITTHRIIGRYASYSPILTGHVSGTFKMFPNNACGDINKPDYKKYEDQILVVLRGNCSFVEKVENIINSELNPKSIIIANDEPHRGLITMYSNKFNTDGSFNVPIMFISYEGYKELNSIRNKHLELTISTVAFGSLMNIVLSMILSPPLLIFLLYTFIKCVQHCREKRMNIANEKFVKNLPIYIYNMNHLIYSKKFYDYLKITNQTENIAFAAESELNSLNRSNSYDGLKMSRSSSKTSVNNFTINGIDVKSIKSQFHILTAPDDFFFSYKCPICLDKFKPLTSRVLVLDCKHCYHEKCLSNWLINFRRTCPLCNNTIKGNDTRYLLSDLESSTYGSFDEDLEAQVLPNSIHTTNRYDEHSNGSPDLNYTNDQVYHAIPKNSSNQLYISNNDDNNDDGEQVYSPPENIDDETQFEPFLSTSTSQNSPKLQTSRVDTAESPNIPGDLIFPKSHKPPTSGGSVGASSMSDASSFFSAKSHFDSRRNSSTSPPNLPPPPPTSSTKYYAKPWQILSRFAPPKLESLHEVSSSIDSEDFATPSRDPDDTDESTIDGQSVGSSTETDLCSDSENGTSI